MEIINPIESQRRKDDTEMPFQKGIRVACPMKHFAQRLTQNCLGCKMFQGTLVRDTRGEMEGLHQEKITKTYSIMCAHPISRKLNYFPED